MRTPSVKLNVLVALFMLAFSYPPLSGYAGAGKMGLAVDHFDLKPKKILEKPGLLEGKWFSNEKNILEVSLDSTILNDSHHENFVIKIKGTDATPLPFYAANGEFRI
jgi:hypothetical protein